MKLLGISGTNGGGKDFLAQHLADTLGYLFISVSDVLRAEAERRGQSSERSILRTISAQWRRESGLGVLVDKAVEEYGRRGGDGKYQGLVIASIRNPGEVERIHELQGLVVWVDADPAIRYARIYSRQRADDRKTFEEFIAEEQAEMHHSGDDATLNMAAVKDRADRTIMNEGSSLAELAVTVKTVLGDVL